MVVGSAERHGELVADLASQGAWLGELQVMRFSRRLLTNQTALAANESEVILAASSGWLLREGKTGLRSGRGADGCANDAGWLSRPACPAADMGGCSAGSISGSAAFSNLFWGLEYASVCLEQSVFERQADLGPCKQSLAAFQAAQLVQEAVQKLGGAFGRQHRGPVQNAPRRLSFRPRRALSLAVPSRHQAHPDRLPRQFRLG